MDFDQVRVIFMESYLESLKEERREYEGTLNLANKMLKFQKFLPFIMALGGFIYGGITNNFSFISYASLHTASIGILYSIPLQLFSYLYWGIAKRRNNNKIADIDDIIECVIAMKRAMEEELELQKGIKPDEVMERYNQNLKVEITMESEEKVDKPKKRVRKLNSRKKK